MMPFWDHVEELRSTLVRIFAIVCTGFLIALIFHQPIFEALTSPLSSLREEGGLKRELIRRERITNRGDEVIHHGDLSLLPGAWAVIDTPVRGEELIILGPIEGMTITLKVALFVALLGTAPLWGYLLFRFAAPGLQGHERVLILPFLALSMVFVIGGLLLGFYGSLPLANRFLYTFNAHIGHNFWSLKHYLNYTVLFAFAHALAFELALILLLLVHIGVIEAKTLKSRRRYACIIVLAIAAILTPPDVVTQVMLALPLLLLYEGAILYATILRGRRRDPAHHTHREGDATHLQGQ